LVETVELYVSHDSNNLSHLVGRESHRQSFANGISPGRTAGHRLADQDRPGGRDIGIAEVAPTQNRNSHRLQEAWSDQAHVDFGCSTSPPPDALDRDGLVRTVPVQGNVIGDSGRLNTGQTAHLLQHAVKELLC